MADEVKAVLLKLAGLLLVLIIIYNLYTGATIQKVGIPGVFEIEFGQGSKTDGPSARIGNVRVDHNVTSNNRTGMDIHTDFFINDFDGGYGEVSIYFFYKDGTPVMDENGAFKTPDGTVGVADRFLTNGDTARYSDFTIFMPYDEILTASGKHDLKFKVVISDVENHEKLAISEWVTFTLTKE